MVSEAREPSAEVIEFSWIDPLLSRLRQEAEAIVRQEPELGGFVHPAILAQESLAAVIAHRVAQRLDRPEAPYTMIRQAFDACLDREPLLLDAIRADLLAVLERDPACTRLIEPVLYFKGFHALQTHRLAHWLWRRGWRGAGRVVSHLSRFLTGIEIHPGAQIGRRLFIDHGMGVVIGETAVVGDNVSMLHSVTLGGTGKEDGDRHPKIGDGVLIGAGAKVLGNIRIGNCSRIAAGSVVLQDIPPMKTVAGVPARIVGEAGCSQPAVSMDHKLTGCVDCD